MTEIMYCWPPGWLQAAKKAGFARQFSSGEWLFESEVARSKLEIFAEEIWKLAEADCKRQQETE